MGDNTNQLCPVPRRLKAARLRATLSQRRLGIAAGIDPSTASARINRYELGKHVPDYSILRAIGRVLGVPVAWFYAEDDGLADWIQQYHDAASEP